MKKQLKLGKNSFSLFETLLCLFILSLVFLNITSKDFYNNFDDEYVLLNKLDNDFNLNSYDSNFNIKSTNLSILINKVDKKVIKVKKIQYSKNIRLFKYDI